MPFTATRILFLRCLARNQIVSSNNQINILATHPSVCLGHRNVVCVFFSHTYSTASHGTKFDTTKPFAYYEILNIPRTAKQSEIKKAYFRMAKIYHPDVSQDPNARENFDNITEAYTTLIDLTQRYFYDRHGYTSEELRKKGTPSIFDWRPKYGIYEDAGSNAKEVEDWFAAQGHTVHEEKITIRQRFKNAYVEYKYGMAYFDFPWKMKQFLASICAWILGLFGFYLALSSSLEYSSEKMGYRKPIPINFKWENDEIYDILWYTGVRKHKPSSQSKGGMYHMPKRNDKPKSEYSHTIYSNTRSRTKKKNMVKYRQLQKEIKEAREKSWSEAKIEAMREKEERKKKSRRLKNDGFSV